MESLAKLHCRFPPLNLSLNHHPASFRKPATSLSFRTLSRSSFSSSLFPLMKSSSIRASSPVEHNQVPPDHKPSLLQTLNPLTKTFGIAVAAAALFFMRFQRNPVIAAPVAVPTMESSKESTDDVSLEEKERIIQEHLSEKPDDGEALRSLMEVRIKSRKLLEAVETIDRLIELEPDEQEWPLLKAHIHCYAGENELAKNEFEELLAKDPLRVEAYHGLVMASSQSGDDLKELVKRIEEAVDKCKKQKKTSEVRDFKLLIAQIRVIEGKYNDALKVYQQLVKEEPRDFRPYLCQGIIYTLLKKNDEAEKQFEKYRRLVPKNHPYAEFFDDNMFATKLFSQRVEREKAGSTS